MSDSSTRTPRRIYNTNEIAWLTNRSVKTVRRWIDWRMLPAQRVGNYWIVERDDLVMFLRIYGKLKPADVVALADRHFDLLRAVREAY